MQSKTPRKLLTPQRIHPLFPTPEEAAANPDIAYSDHLMTLTAVPLPNDTFLNIISLNILGSLSCSGIHNPNARETNEMITARYKRIVEGLTKAIQTHQVDILAFQEARPEYIVPILQQQLKEPWEIIKDEKSGLVTCFKTDRWKGLNTSINNDARIRKLTLQSKQDPELTVDFHNIWGIFDELPVTLENQCETTLTTSKATVAIIMGDTNSRLAPLDNKERNITTGAIPLMFNAANGVEPGVQLPDYPDGGFYRGQDGIIHQLTIHTLNFVTGDIYIDKRMAHEMAFWPGYRMIMCLDKQFKETPVIHGQTVFDYQTLMRTTLDNENIVVRQAADCFNHKAIAIGFLKDNRQTPQDKQLNGLVTFIVEHLPNTQGFEARELTSYCLGNKRGAEFTCIFAPTKQAHLLHSAINSAIHLLPVLNKLTLEDKPLAVDWTIFEDNAEKNPAAVPAQHGLFAVKDDTEKKPAVFFKPHTGDQAVTEIIKKLRHGCQLYMGPDKPLIRHGGIIRAESFEHIFNSSHASKTCLAIAALALLNPDTGKKGLFGGSSKGTGLVQQLLKMITREEIATLHTVVNASGLEPALLKNIQNAIIDCATEGKYDRQTDLTDMDILSFSRELVAKHHINW